MDAETQYLKILREERLLLLAYYSFSQQQDNAPSSGFFLRLKHEALGLIKKQLLLLKLTHDLHAALEKEHIPHVFLKGPALNQLLWGARTVRYSGDLDVLVRVKDIFKADAALSQLGFSASLSKGVQKFHQITYRYSTKKDAEYSKKGFPYKVELHWKMTTGIHLFSPYDAWVNCITYHQGLPMLCDMEYILYLCLHAAKHGWSRLLWLVDIIKFIDKQQIDIIALRKLAHQKHILQAVDEAIYLAKHWLNIQLMPESLFSELVVNSPRLNKRLYYGRLDRATNQPGIAVKKRFFLNFICSNKKQQILIWLKIYTGACLIFAGRKLLARNSKTL